MTSYYATMLIAIPFFILALLAQWNVSATFKKYARIGNRRGMTGVDAAKYILNKNGIYDVEVEVGGGFVGDHYDPTAKKIRLSHDNYYGASLLAVSVAAHEVGHAIQHAQGYSPIKLRWAFLPLANIGSQVAPLLAIGGIIFQWAGLIDIGILFYTATVIFQVITLPIEFNASSRAMKAMDSSLILDVQELGSAKKILGAAALTYVAAAGVAIGELIRLLLLRNMMGDRD